MRHHPYTKLTWMLGSALCLLLSSGAWAENWRISIGPIYRGGMELKITGASYVQAQGLHAAQPYGCVPYPGEPDGDDISQIGDRAFEDGYVFMDAATPTDGQTWYWGYDNDSQYDNDMNTLAFQGNDELSASETCERVFVDTLRNEGVSVTDDLDALGLELIASRTICERDALRVDLRIGLAVFQQINHTSHASTYEENIRAERWQRTDTYQIDSTYTYDTTGIDAPAAPYEGTYDGPGPFIPNRPESMDEDISHGSSALAMISSREWTTRNEMTFDVEMDLSELWVGPTLAWTTGERFAFTVTPMLSLNVLDVQGERKEQWIADYGQGHTEVMQSWSDQFDETEWLFGTGLRGGVEFDINAYWYAALSAGYQWVPDSCEIHVGPNKISIDISVFDAKAEVGRRF